MAPLLNSSEKLLQRGFTLIELMIVVAIVAILAAVALPSYNDYLRRGELPEAFTYLSNYRIKLEQYYQDNRTYGAGTDCGGGSLVQTSPEGTKYFQFSCVPTNSGAGYTLTATGAAGHSTGHEYTINEANQKKTTKFKNATVTGKNCWLVKGSEC